MVQDVERDDIEFISKTLGCLPIAHIDSMRPEKLARADLVQEVDVSPVSSPLASVVCGVPMTLVVGLSMQ